tara:strand:+ start:2275 stop:2610 length:336 start_codon:yes stop_codon:yes gene_type:complete
MGPGMFDGLGKALATVAVIGVAFSVAAGYGIAQFNGDDDQEMGVALTQAQSENLTAIDRTALQNRLESETAAFFKENGYDCTIDETKKHLFNDGSVCTKRVAPLRPAANGS